jgi:hypothetical protein
MNILANQQSRGKVTAIVMELGNLVDSWLRIEMSQFLQILRALLQSQPKLGHFSCPENPAKYRWFCMTIRK